MAEKKRFTPTTRRDKGERSEEAETTGETVPLSFGFLERRGAVRKRRRTKRGG